MATLNIALKNQTNSASVYAYITGLAIDNNSALFMLQADGQTAYFPSSPASTLSALGADCAIPLGAPGSTKTVTIPHLAGARLWFVRDGQLTFYLNPGPALVEPSPSNPTDPNYHLFWDFCEFTWNESQLYVNITFVDFVSLPIALTLTNTAGVSQTVEGLPTNGLDAICADLTAQNAKDNAGWNQLIVPAPNGANLRAVSPNTGITMNNTLFSNYYEPYVNEVWSKYTNVNLTVDTQAGAGSITAKVAADQLAFLTTESISYAQPSTADIFSNSSGAFAVSGNSTKDAITARLAAAFNRSTLLIDANQPDGENVTDYYQNPITNHYSRICHATTPDGRGYAFPYDDVAPSNGADQSGSVFDPSPVLLTVTVGGGGLGGSSSKETQPADPSAATAITPAAFAPVQSQQNASGTVQGHQGATQAQGPRKRLKNFMRRLLCRQGNS